MMNHSQTKEQCVIGIVGLGLMGRNLLLNMADHGISVAGYDQDLNKVESLYQTVKRHDVYLTANLKDFIDVLRLPRAILLLVPAGTIIDAVINQILPYLQENDLIIDAGNSYFKDTNARLQQLKANHIQFLGLGISGGEEGARQGPSLMPGGTPEAYEQVRPLLEAIAAKVNGVPCVSYLGVGSAGHFVKMVHNGIEYAMMQLIAESYDLMKRGLGLNNNQLGDVFAKWNAGDLKGYLVDITSHIFNKIDETGQRPIDMILGRVKQKGTGMWTSQIARELQVPIPTIDLAVTMRDFSAYTKEREHADEIYKNPARRFNMDDLNAFIIELGHALFTAIIIVYAQGLSLLAVASDKYDYHLDLEAIARIWRAGCIIRTALLDDIYAAFREQKHLPNILLDANLSEKIIKFQHHLRQVICHSAAVGIPVPALMASLSYLDTYRSAWLPANLIQAQRDYFGSHTYQRIDTPGVFHTQWREGVS